MCIATPIPGAKTARKISFDFVITTLPAVECINVLPSFSAILRAAPTTISPIAESSFRERPLFVLLEKPRYRTDLPVVCERACTQNTLEQGRKRHCLRMYSCAEGSGARQRGRIKQERGREQEREGTNCGVWSVSGKGKSRLEGKLIVEHVRQRETHYSRMGRCHGNLCSFHPLARSLARWLVSKNERGGGTAQEREWENGE